LTQGASGHKIEAHQERKKKEKKKIIIDKPNHSRSHIGPL